MNELTIPAGKFQQLILRTRAVMAREADGPSDFGDGALIDGAAAALAETEEDMSRSELHGEIASLSRGQQHQLVALMWIGRGDGDPEDWAELVDLAAQRHAGPAAEYLFSHPMVADYWLEGLDRLYGGTDIMDTGEY
jgi:Protein of unknown function (DUF3775)